MKKIVIIYLSGVRNILFANDISKKFVTTAPPPKKKYTSRRDHHILHNAITHTSACKYKSLKQYVR